MKNFKVNEIYSSVQGEGPRVGEPTVFVRFSGCNMRCPGWPCDTPYAIYPEIWKNDPSMTVGDIVAKVADLGSDNVCITGGEPTMQPEEPLEELAEILLDEGYTIDMFTNGSLKLFPDWIGQHGVVIIMDWKLQGSGEADRGIGIRIQNLKKLQPKDAVKFVIAHENDLEEAYTLWNDFRNNCPAQVYVGAAWGWVPESAVVDWVLERRLPWKLNVQVHKFIWPGVERGI